MKKIFVALILLLFLSGCATTSGDTTVIDNKKTVQIDQRLLQECPDLVEIKEPTEEAILKANKEWLAQYKTCRAWKHELNETVKKAFNLP